MTATVRPAIGLVLLAVGLLTACGAVSRSQQQPAANGQSTATAAAPAPSGLPGTLPGQRPPLRTPPIDQRVVVVREQDNGHAISLQIGDQVELVLSSTYWRLGAVSDPAVLREAAPPVVAPQPTGCVPGEGCGTLTARFAAIAAGRADISARRTSCGEALSCTGNLGFYRLTIIVAG